MDDIMNVLLRAGLAIILIVLVMQIVRVLEDRKKK